jgi:hypothetical protein
MNRIAPKSARVASVITALAALALMTGGLTGCGEQTDSPAADAEQKQAQAQTEAPAPEVVEIRAVGKTFEAPAELPSGWTTFRFVNASDMIHFGLIDVPPDGISLAVMNEQVILPFQEAMDAMIAADQEGVNAAFGKMPAWISELGRNGGPGLLAPGHTGQTTVYLEPGRYWLECYVKSDGVFHTTPPAEGELGMVMEFRVTEALSGAEEPRSNASVLITNSGYVLAGGELRPGENTIRVDFIEQQALPSFVGNDIHLMRVNDPQDIARANAWMDWRAPDGLEDPAPVEFLGGINDLPAGQTGYFTVDLAPGDYAFIAEMPDPLAAGFVMPFSVR